MQFLYPGFLWALLALLIPIIIHLFHFRRYKKVFFTNVRFLKEVKDETSSRSRLKHLLVLLSRLLILALLVLAFAQPFIPVGDGNREDGKRAVSVFVDNSYSMAALTQGAPLLEEGKRRAREIVQGYDVEDEFQIITHDMTGRQQRLVGQEEALSMINEIEIGPKVKTLDKIQGRQTRALNTAEAANLSAYFISDFQKNITSLDEKIDSSKKQFLIPLQSAQTRNVAIDSAWFEAPVQMLNQANRLIVRMRNYGDVASDESPLTLRLNGQVRPVGNIEIPAAGTVYDTINVSLVKPGWYEAVLTLTDYPVTFDDAYNFSFYVAARVAIMSINGSLPDRYLTAAFDGDSYFQLTNTPAGKINYSTFKNQQLIVLNDIPQISSGLASELKQYVQGGGNALVFPAANAPVTSYNSFLTSMNANKLNAWQVEDKEVGRLNTEEFIFSDVYINSRANLKLPTTSGNFSIVRNRATEILVRYRDGSPFLAKYALGSGHIYVCSAPLNSKLSGLSRSADVFIPMIYKMALAGTRARPIAYTIGQSEIIEIENRASGGESIYKMKGKADEFIPQQKAIGPRVILTTGESVRTAGFYDVFLQQDSTLEKLAFNDDRLESDLAAFSKDELKARYQDQYTILDIAADTDLGNLVRERSRGIVLWKWCLIGALIFLLIEVLLLRFWKT